MNVLFLESKEKVCRLIGYGLENKGDITFNYDGEKKLIFGSISKYDVIINFNHANYFHQHIISKAKRLGILTILLHDGIFEWKNTFTNNCSLPLYHPVNHHVFFMFGGDLEYEYFEYLLPKSNVIIKYVPYYLRNVMKCTNSIESDYQFLITTANKPYFCNDELVRLSSLISDVILNFERLSLTYKVRIFDKKLLSLLKLNKNIVNDIDSSLSNCIRNVDAVITTKSTLTLEVIKAEKPVAELIYRDSPVFSNPAWLIHSNIDFDETFKSILSQDKNRMLLQKKVLEQHFRLSKIDNDVFDNLPRLKVCKRKAVVLLKILLGKL